ncbi:MAG: hypothetical protein A2X61_11260 [Ignavibacteria bacterium GWB2_35_12]|nr:MAG: hypothetical protein A2X61_11260 [Ignavibacteria bacterium GWB2_35_12]OGU89757.1 MAG: hypothetical protein A2220_02825 [Ignavibacteria bacterium RIFOXYA2_FULL_35_10]OGV24014.1 MAG: hypothetical protein A2475_10905 [Ignavibacteria bacterium RIFOXYC2_FULL_35_21]
MRTLIIIFIFISTAIFLYSADHPYELAKINIDLNDINKNNKTKTVEFLTSSKKSIGKYICVDVNEIISENLKHLSEQEKCRLMIVAESSSGEAITSTYFDYDANNIKIPPILILNNVKGMVGDTIKVLDVKGKKGIVDLSMVERELQKSIVERVYLQIKNITTDEKNKIFKSGSIVFPQDKATKRWIGSVSNIKIYIIK